MPVKRANDHTADLLAGCKPTLSVPQRNGRTKIVQPLLAGEQLADRVGLSELLGQRRILQTGRVFGTVGEVGTQRPGGISRVADRFPDRDLIVADREVRLKFRLGERL